MDETKTPDDVGGTTTQNVYSQEDLAAMDSLTGTTSAKVEVETKDEPVAEGSVSLKAPVRFEGETDTQYNLRTQIHVHQEQKGLAETDEEKDKIKGYIKELRKNGLAKISSETKEDVKQKEVSDDVEFDFESEEQRKEVRAALKKAGIDPEKVVFKEDIDQKFKEIEDKFNSGKLQQREQEQEDAITSFLTGNKEIASDKNKTEALLNVVQTRYKITTESTKEDILFAFESAANYLFPKRTVNKALEANEKANTASINGKTSKTETEKYSKADVDQINKLFGI